MLVEVDFLMANWRFQCKKQVYYSNVTFITGVDAITLTNGARVEWLNSSRILQQHQ